MPAHGMKVGCGTSRDSRYGLSQEREQRRKGLREKAGLRLERRATPVHGCLWSGVAHIQLIMFTDKGSTGPGMQRTLDDVS